MANETPTHNLNPFNFADTISRLLPRGHAIYGYSAANHSRRLMVLESLEHADTAPLLGYGIDGTAERALGRALLTYGIREREGWEYITEQQLPESSAGPYLTEEQLGRSSRFDRIVWGGRFRLYRAGDEVVAASDFGGGYGLEPLEVRAPNAAGAITILADTYRFLNGSLDHLPVMTIE
jgi:hypothetical protein